MTLLSVGKKAPTFNLPDQYNQFHQLSDYAGQWVVLYFYPKDDTSGCTTEACAITEVYDDFAKLDVPVLGVSKDSPKSHLKFAEKFHLPFTLLSDESTKMIDQYGAWQERSLYGRKFMGTVRISYVIDPAGKIAAVYPKVEPASHALQLLADIKTLKQAHTKK